MADTMTTPAAPAVVTDAKALAAALIGTKHLPAGLSTIITLAREAQAYHDLEPYPEWWFKDWKREDRGPLPRAMPFARSIVRRGARWLFGQEVQITCPGNKAVEDLLRDAWCENAMGARLPAIAQRGGLDGGVALKFAYDEQAQPALSIQSLSVTEQCRLYYHPHDRGRLLMARVQYPFFDAVSGTTYYYREEWTAEDEVHYLPVAAENLGRRQDPDAYEGWEQVSRAPNPFGLIPVFPIRNQETDDTWGAGDLWGLFRVCDRINLTYHLMDRSNQYDSQLNPFFVDLDLDDEDINKPVEPGEPVDLQTKGDAEGRQGKVQFPPSGNSLRPAMMEYAKDLRRQVLAAASSTELDPSEITNKGNLTESVLKFLFQAQIEGTEEKRKTYGENGLERFLEGAAIGLQRAGVPLGLNEAQEDTYDIELKWPRYFGLSQEEMTAAVARIQEEEAGGYVGRDRAVEEVSNLEGRNAAAVKDELAKEPPKPAPSPTASDPRMARVGMQDGGDNGQ